MKKFKIGIMGAGRGIDIAKNLMLLNCEIVALCEFNENRAKRGLKNLGMVVPVFENFNDFIDGLRKELQKCI